jgi:redox-sensitive bicupin YhaK (pirin superfamily)
VTIELRPGSRRFVTSEAGRETFHSFSFGRHYDPGNVGFAAMVAHNDENLGPGTGYGDHPHADVEILTWVIEGALRHSDSTGQAVVLGPGELLRTSAGRGIVHAEVAEPGTSTRFLQTWLRPDESGGVPSFAHGHVSEPGQLTEVVGPGGAVGVGTSGAGLWIAHAEGKLVLPDARALHLFVISGNVEVGDRALGPGDAARLVGEGGRVLEVGHHATVSVWAFS